MWPTDLDYGMFGFSYEGKACGGVIKENPEDFVVIEVDPNTNNHIPRPPKPMNYRFDEGGLFLYGRMWRVNHDHSRMIRMLAKQFGVREEDVHTAGIKDARAEIIQLFSIYQPRKEFDDHVIMDIGMEIDEFQYGREKLYPGSMGGNYFEITIRNITSFDENDLTEFTNTIVDGIPNYYGYQRFGSYRPITAQFGRAIAKNEYKKAVDIYLGGKSVRDDEEYRAHWRENHDPDELLLIWDDVPVIERDILRHLSKRNADYRGATSKFPEFLISIGKSAFISLLFNHYISRRGIKEPILPGEREIDENIEIALPSGRWKEPLNEIWEEVFEQFSIEIKKDLKNIRHTTRMLKLLPDKFEGKIKDNHTLEVQFQLENGQYATTLLRELMQQPPSSYF